MAGCPSSASMSTHVLDTEAGRPALGVPIVLLDVAGAEIARACTDADGRVACLADGLSAGVYTLRVELGRPFLRSLAVELSIGPVDEHLHVPILFSGHSAVVYRGT